MTDLDSRHFHIFCNTIIYSDGGKRLERVGTIYESNNDSQEATTSHNKSNTNHNESKMNHNE